MLFGLQHNRHAWIVSLKVPVRGVGSDSLFPVIGRQSHSPDVPWLVQRDAAAHRACGIDVDYRGRRS